MMLALARRIAVRAPSYATYARERPGWVILILFGRLKWARWLERKLRTKTLLLIQLPASEDIYSPTADIVARRLARDGVCEGFSLSAAILKEIRTFADDNLCSPRAADGISFFPRDFAAANRYRSTDILAAYYFSSVERSDAINRLLIDPRLLSVARNYLGQAAKNIRVRLWWSFPARRFDDADLRRAAQDRFHFDLNDWRTLKFFFYLTDVDEVSGPHLYIRGSHRRRGLRHQYTLFHGQERGDLESYYGIDRFISITGQAGSGFSEDPFVFHTGTVVQASPRLILELEFGPCDPSPSYRYGALG